MPSSQIGAPPFSALGPTGTLGPVNGTPGIFASNPVSVTVTVNNGTVGSHTTGVAQVVEFLNQSAKLWGLGTITGRTTAGGTLTVSVPAGYWTLGVIPSANTHLPFYSIVYVSSSNNAFTVYLLPTSVETVTLSNGGTAWGSFWISLGNSSGQPFYQEAVQLLNGSNGPVLATAYTGYANGTVSFLHLNPAYTYEALMMSTSASENGWNWGIQTNSATRAISANVATSVTFDPSGGTTSKTAIVTGVAPPGTSAWTISSNTVVTGGNIVISEPVSSTGSNKLTFVNTIVYFNFSQTLNNLGNAFQPGIVNFQNSTIVALVPFTDTTASVSFTLSHCWVLYDANYATKFFQTTIPLMPENNVQWTILSGFDLQDVNNQATALTGIWLNDNVSDSIFLPIAHATVNHTAWYNDQIYVETWANVTFSTFLNFSMVAYEPGTQVGQGLRFANDWMGHFTFLPIGNGSFQGVQSSSFGAPNYGANSLLQLNYVVGSAGLPANRVQNSSITSTTIILSEPLGVNYNATGNYNVHPTGTNGQNVILPTHSTFSLDNISEVVPDGGMNVGTGINDTWTNDVFWLPFTMKQVAYWDGSTRFTANQPAGITIFSNFPILYGNDTFSHNYYNAQAGVQFAGPGNVVSNNLFLNLSNYEVSGFVTTDSESAQTPQEFVNVNNNTIFPGFVNYSATASLPYTAPAPSAAYGIDDIGTGYGGNGFASGTFVHNSVLHQPGGIHPSLWNYFPSIVEGKWTNVSYNLFQNYGQFGPSMALTEPFGADIDLIAANSTTYVLGNYFLGLNNGTVPWVFLKSQPAGFPLAQSVKPIGNLANFVASGNHFYFAPLAGQNSFPAQGTWTNLTSPNSFSRYQDAYMTLQNYSGHTTITSPNQYVFNTTVKFPLTFGAPYITPPNDYMWAIAPDLNVSSGAPVLSYANGLVAGPQPNFLWHGFAYSESVEPLQIEIGVNSSSAPQVTVSFSGLGSGALYAYAEFNGTSGKQVSPTSNNYVYPNSGGWINFTFAPSTGLLNEIFVLYPAGGGGFFAANTGGLFIDFLIILVGGMVLVGIPLVLALAGRRGDGP